MQKRRDIEVFSLSFLDCICCGFGAIILLFVLTIGPIRKETQESEQGASKFIQSLEAQLQRVQERSLQAVEALQELQAQAVEPIDEQDLRASVLSMERKIDSTRQVIKDTEAKIESLKQRQAAPQLPLNPIGITAESDHILFLIDTSGSMRGSSGRLNALVLDQIEIILETYPKVKAMQILDCNGQYILPGSRKQWLQDSPRQRQELLRALSVYMFPSVSNPIPGLVKIFADFDPERNSDKNIGIYIFGDEFPGTASDVLQRIDKLNPMDPATQQRPAVINAVGFPFRIGHNPSPHDTGFKFANLMRELAYRHGGTFIIAR